MDNKLLNTLIKDINNVLTKENLKETLKLPIYSYLLGFVLGIIALIVITVLKPEISTEPLGAENFGFMPSPTWSYIVEHNTMTLILFFLSGIILYIGPLFSIGLNGLIHGLVLAGTIKVYGVMGAVAFFALMAPHSVFELPALILGAGTGVILSKQLQYLITIKFLNKRKLYDAFLMLFIAFILVIIASVVEINVTYKLFPYVLKYISNT
jgi:stage II sporulation protein M